MKTFIITFFLLSNVSIEKLNVTIKSNSRCISVAEQIMKINSIYQYPNTRKNGYYTKQNKLIIGFSCYEKL